MLKVGEPAPPFSATATNGKKVSLEGFRGQILVLYFFRRAFTRNCTVETRGFRDNYDDLRAQGAEVVGVSCDDFSTQCSFTKSEGVTFPMIADADRQISRDFRVFFRLFPISHRVTYVIDQNGTVAGVFNHEFQVVKHLDEVLRFVRTLSGGSGPPSSPPFSVRGGS
jgi:peroxiredoxin Q/BCP